MIILTDSREQNSLEFNDCKGVEFKRVCLPVGDYTATYNIDGKERQSDTVFERKSVGDMWNSFTGENYERERDKMMRYKDCGFDKYILAIEASAFEIRMGHSYRAGGEEHVSKKDGLSMLRQLLTCMRKYGIWVWLFNGRKEMAFMIQEYFLSEEKYLIKTENGGINHGRRSNIQQKREHDGKRNEDVEHYRKHD